MSLASIQDDNRDHKDCMGRPEAVAACQVQRLNEKFWPTPTRLSNCVIVDTSVSFLVVLLRSRSSFGEGFNPIIWLRSKRRYSSLNFFSTHSISGLSWEAGSLRKPQCGQTHFLLSILTVSCVGLYEASKSIFAARIISISLSSFLNFLGFQWNAHPLDSTKSGDSSSTSLCCTQSELHCISRRRAPYP